MEYYDMLYPLTWTVDNGERCTCCSVSSLEINIMDYERFRVVEFYTGIGGMNFAMKRTNLPYHIVGAMELNDAANEVYRYNFPDDNLLQKNIEGLAVKEMEQLNPNVILMSPPCQPFTRVGNQRASDDPRTKSFLNILSIVSNMKNPPKYILLENVKGFEESETRGQLIETLEKVGYNYQEFLISPKQFDVPNSRLRYYLLAKLKPLEFTFVTSSKPMQSLPQCCLAQHDASDGHVQKKLCEFLENPKTVDDQLYLSSEVLGKLGSVLDIVTPSSTNSCCFTKAYGTYIKGTGSVLTEKTEQEIHRVFEQAAEQDQTSKGKTLLQLNLRYFSPQEIANLMCFPKSFGFPSFVTKKQRYRLLGNSVNVQVVAELLKGCLLTEVA